MYRYVAADGSFSFNVERVDVRHEARTVGKAATRWRPQFNTLTAHGFYTVYQITLGIVLEYVFSVFLFIC